MKKSDELKQQRAALLKAQQDLHDKAQKEGRALNDDETKEFRARQEEIKGFAQRIQDAEDQEENLRMLGQVAPSVAGAPVGDGEQRELADLMKDYSLHKALRSQMRNGTLDGVEKEVHEITVKRAKEEGVAIKGLGIPTGFDKRFAGQSVTQDAGGYGAALVPTEQREVIDFLRPKPILQRAGASYLTGLTGNLEFPVNEGGIVATWAGEVDSATRSKNAYTSKSMTPKRLVAAVPISLQNLMQSSIDLERYTKDEINQVMANALDLAAINGSGTGNVPLGILNTTGINVVPGGTNGAAPSWAQIVAMETGVYVANADASKMGYLLNPASKGRLKVAKHEAGDLGYLMATDNTINGYDAYVSNLVPGALTKGTGTNLSAAIFGDMSQVVIGQWGWVDVTVDDISKKADGYIEIIVNMFADVLVKQPKAFSVVKDWITV